MNKTENLLNVVEKAGFNKTLADNKNVSGNNMLPVVKPLIEIAVANGHIVLENGVITKGSDLVSWASLSREFGSDANVIAYINQISQNKKINGITK